MTEVAPLAVAQRNEVAGGVILHRALDILSGGLELETVKLNYKEESP